jgi:inhibitor of cysteine peptidase
MDSHSKRLCASARSLLRLVVSVSPAILVACGSSPAPNDPATATNNTTTTETTTTAETTTASTPTATAKTPATINASKNDNGKTLEAKVGDTVVLSLEENLSTGFGWRVSKEPDAAVLKVELSEAKSGKNKSPEGKLILGAPGTHEWTLRATGAGTATLTLDHMPPGGKSPAETFTITVRVAD